MHKILHQVIADHFSTITQVIFPPIITNGNQTLIKEYLTKSIKQKMGWYLSAGEINVANFWLMKNMLPCRENYTNNENYKTQIKRSLYITNALLKLKRFPTQENMRGIMYIEIVIF